MLLTTAAYDGAVLQRAHLIHVALTLGLFVANLLLTQMITTDRFIGRLKYIGHEMVFLACGIVLSRIFTASSGDSRVMVLVVLFFYMFVWLLTLFLTKKVVSSAPIMSPLIGATLLLGLASVASALSGLVEHWAVRALASLAG